MTTKKDKKQQFIEKAITKMFEIAGHDITFEDAIKIDKFYDKHTITEEQHKQWEQWFLEEVNKNLGYRKTRAKWEFSWFDLHWGLKIENK